MESKTFIFRSEKTWRRVCAALNDTMYVFTAYTPKEIRVWGAPAIAEVRNACDAAGIKYTEI